VSYSQLSSASAYTNHTDSESNAENMQTKHGLNIRQFWYLGNNKK